MKVKGEFYMRLWHWQLIPVLPREQLVAAWREISACARETLKLIFKELIYKAIN